MFIYIINNYCIKNKNDNYIVFFLGKKTTINYTRVYNNKIKYPTKKN